MFGLLVVTLTSHRGQPVDHAEGFPITMTESTPTPTSPMTASQLAAQIPKDLGLAGAPPALAEAVEAMRKIMTQQSEDNARLRQAQDNARGQGGEKGHG